MYEFCKEMTRMKSYVYEMTIVTKWKREYGSWQKWVKKHERNKLVGDNIYGEIITAFPNDFAFRVPRNYKRKESNINSMYLGKYTVQVCSKDYLTHGLCKRQSGYGNGNVITQYSGAQKLLYEANSLNMLISLCDSTAEQRQLLSESKRWGMLQKFTDS